MSAPLYQALLDYADRKTARFHMPGHKGTLPPPFDAVAPLDVTELRGTGDLYYEADGGAIRASERAMSVLYGAEDCCYLTGGATQGIYTMLAAATRPGDTVYVDRICHRSVYNALALLDLRPIWLRRGIISPWGVPGVFIEKPEGNCPVIYTSPNYYGVIVPKPRTGGIVLGDAAHGAHLPFCLDGYTPPGDIWTVSAHKTLGALGQTACLLSGGTIDRAVLREQTAVFGTASPSFVLLASLDAARDRLEHSGQADWERVAAFTRMLAQRDARILSGGALPEDCKADPARLTVYTGDGYGDAERLERELGVVCEAADERNLIFMLSPHNSDEDFIRLERALETIPFRQPNGDVPDIVKLPVALTTPREAFYAKREQVALKNAAGRIAACAFAPVAPGVPLFAPGERIDKKTLEIFAGMCYNGDEPIWVVR